MEKGDFTLVEARVLGTLRPGQAFRTTLTGREGYVATPEEQARLYVPQDAAVPGAGNVRVVFEDGEIRPVRELLVVEVEG